MCRAGIPKSSDFARLNGPKRPVRHWKTIRHAVLITLAAIGILIAAAFVLVHTEIVTGYVRGKIVRTAESSLGLRVNIGKVALSWDHLGITLHDITIHSSGAPAAPPFFYAFKLSVQVKLAPLFHGNFQLGKVDLDRPVVHFPVNQQGQTNIPALASMTNLPIKSSASSPSSVKPLFNLAIRRLIVSDGTIYYKDETIPLSADLADFGANVRFNVASHDYAGTIGYTNGRIRAKNLPSVKTTASLQFTASPSGIKCNPLIVTMPNSRLRLYAAVRNYSHPSIRGNYTADLSTQEVGQLVGSTALPVGQVKTSGTIAYHGKHCQGFLESVQLKGSLTSPNLSVRIKQFSTSVKALRAEYGLANGKLRIAGVQGRVLGGSLSANGGELNLTGNSRSHLDARLTGVSLRDVSQALPPEPHNQLSLIGRADVTAQASWASGFTGLIVHSRTTISSQQHIAPEMGAIPLNGIVRVSYNEALGRASFGNSHLQVGATTVTINGLLSKHSNLKVALSTSDLHQFSQLATTIQGAMSSDNSKAASRFQMPNVSGRARLNGRVYGSLQNPQLHGYLAASDVGIRSTKWKTIQTTISLSPFKAALNNGILVSQAQERIEFNASAGLRHWSVAPSSAISLQAKIAQLRIASAQALANVSYPVSGFVSAELAINGTKQHPSSHGWIRVTKASAWRQPLTLATMNFHGGARELYAVLAVEAPAGTISGNLKYDFASKHYKADLTTPGVRLGEIKLVRERRLDLRGTLIASASGEGTIANPELAANLRIPQLEFRGQSISNARSHLNVANHGAKFTVAAAIDQGPLQSQGYVELAGGYMISATLDVHSISMGRILATYAPKTQPGLTGTADVHAEIHGPLKNPSELTIRAEVPTLSFGYRTVRVALVRPLQMDYRNGVATLRKSEIKGTGIELTFQGAIPVKRAAPFKIAAEGTVDMSLLQAVTTGIRSSGTMQVAIAGEGTLSNPALQGDLRLHDVSLSSGSLPVIVSKMKGNLRLAGNRIEIATLSGDVNGGSMRAQGSVTVSSHPSFDLAVDARSVDLNYPTGIRSRLDATLRLNGAASHSALTGQVVIDYLGFARRMDVTSLASQFSSSGGGLSTPSKLQKNMTLNIAVQSSSTLSLASSQLSVEGTANLDIVGTLANPVVLGRATLAAGELFFLGKRYEIKTGTIQFANPAHTVPSVDLYATTTVNQYDVSLHFFGPVSQLKTSFTSTPALPPADIINLLAFGKTTEQAIAPSATPGLLGAESVLAQGVTSQISAKIQRLGGISQLSITPIIGNGQQNPGAQLAVQQRVSGRLLVTFTTNTSETQSTAVQVQYQLGHGLSVSALRDQNGGYGVDIHLHKSF